MLLGNNIKLFPFLGLLLLSLQLPTAAFAQTVEGMAAYYNDKFHGRYTASGEIYDKNGYSTASPDLPFGTVWKVTNLTNGKTVVVKVTDRMQPKDGRILDLSRAAAEAIDMVQLGTVKVTASQVPIDTPLGPEGGAATTAVADPYAQAAVDPTATGNTEVDYQMQAAEGPATAEQPAVTVNNELYEATKPLPEADAGTGQSVTGMIADSLVSFRFLEEIGMAEDGKTQFGKASFLMEGQAQQQRGELFALHARYPAGTVLKVTNLENGKLLTLKVKGKPLEQQPPVNVVTLSHAAAKLMGVAEAPNTDISVQPIAQVALPLPEQLATAKVVSKPMAAAQIVENMKAVGTFNLSGKKVMPTGVGVQVAAYTDAEAALEKANEMAALNFRDVYIQSGWQSGKRSYRILIGAFDTEAGARPLVEFLKQGGIKAFYKDHF